MFELMNENNSTIIIYPLNNPNNPPSEKSTNPDLFGWIIPIITLFTDDNNIYETIRVTKKMTISARV